jgi:hypothetical protein
MAEQSGVGDENTRGARLRRAHAGLEQLHELRDLLHDHLGHAGCFTNFSFAWTAGG